MQKVEELPKLTKLRCHQYALAKFNDKLHRVKVLEVQNYTLARLVFLDLGIVKMHKMNEMYEISSELLGLTCYTMLMQLKDVPNYTMGEDVCKFLSQFTNERFQITYGSKGCVELIHVNTHLSLNEQIRQFCSKRQVFGKEPTVASCPKLEKPIQADPQTSLAKETSVSEIAQVQECQGATNNIEEVSLKQKLNINKNTSLEVVEPKLNKAQLVLQHLKKAALNTNGVAEELTDQAKLNAKAKDVPIAEKTSNIKEYPLNKEIVDENQTSCQNNDNFEKSEISVKPIPIAKPVNDDSIVSEEINVNLSKSPLSPKPNPTEIPNDNTKVSQEIKVNEEKSSFPLEMPDDPKLSLESVLAALNSKSSSTKGPENSEQGAKDQRAVKPCLHPVRNLYVLSSKTLYKSFNFYSPLNCGA